MPKKNSHKDRTLTLGPVLGVESQDKRPTYTCIVVMQSENPPQWKIDGQEVLFRPCAKTSGGTCWRAEWQPPLEREVGRPVTYSIIGDRKPWMGAGGEDTWAFYLPGSAETPKFVYASCNGFSAAKLMASCEAPHAMWSRLEKDHEESPLSLLVMGGDQIYADSIWEQEWMREFAAKSAGEMAASPVPPGDRFESRCLLRATVLPAVELCRGCTDACPHSVHHDVGRPRHF